MQPLTASTTTASHNSHQHQPPVRWIVRWIPSSVRLCVHGIQGMNPFDHQDPADVRNSGTPQDNRMIHSPDDPAGAGIFTYKTGSFMGDFCR